MQSLSLGFSPCPNDTFMFYPLLNNLVDTLGLNYRERIEDVETLNKLAIAKTLDVTKVSYHALCHIRGEYALLRSGSALGRGCGPLLVASEEFDLRTLAGKTVAIPGRYTTAKLLLQLFNPAVDKFIEMPFNEIMNAVALGHVDAGLIIHESRFTYSGFGLVKLLDLGEWWEKETSLPLPLGGIVARRSLGQETISRIEESLCRGVAFSRANNGIAAGFIRNHAQEMSEEVCASHISLYVNDFSEDIGDEGIKAIKTLLAMAEAAGVVPRSETNLF